MVLDKEMAKIMDLTDIELVQKALSNDEEAKEELLFRCKDVMSYHVQRYKKLYFGQLNAHDIEDLVSECHIAVLESIQLYKPDKGSGFSNFAKFIIRSRLVDYLRKKSRQSRLIDTGSDVYDAEAAKPIESPMERLDITKLSDRDKQIVALILSGEMNQVEVAKHFGITKGRVNHILKKCVKVKNG